VVIFPLKSDILRGNRIWNDKETIYIELAMDFSIF